MHSPGGARAKRRVDVVLDAAAVEKEEKEKRTEGERDVEGEVGVGGKASYRVELSLSKVLGEVGAEEVGRFLVSRMGRERVVSVGATKGGVAEAGCGGVCEGVCVEVASPADAAEVAACVAALEERERGAEAARKRALGIAAKSYAVGVVSAAARMAVVNSAEVGYREPEDAAAPVEGDGWRAFVFRKGDPLGSENGCVNLDRQRFYLFGRDRAVSHVLMGHPSCSKQHAVVQFRRISKQQYCVERGAAWGEIDVEEWELADDEMIVVPHVVDLQSRNGTYLNGHRIPADTYIPLKPCDSLTFGASPREWMFVRHDSDG